MNKTSQTDLVAKVRGIPFLEIPQDLYIPPEALEVFLGIFEGPLDLLLYLIRKHNLNIMDIPMVELTRQYITYVETMRTDQFELAAEYLLMTALLINIKSRMLLPRTATALQDETNDPRAELVRRLLEYKQIKQAAMHIHTLPLVGRDFMPVQIRVIGPVAKKRSPDIYLQDLYGVWLELLERIKTTHPHTIRHETISVRACMSEILKNLQSRGNAPFTELLSDIAGINKLISGFLALLELTREALIDITQSERFGTIHVYFIRPERTD